MATLTTTTASSLLLSSINPKTHSLFLSNNKPTSLSFFSHSPSSSSSSLHPISLLLQNKHQEQNFLLLPSSCFRRRNVAASSEFRLSSEGFPQDLKLYVGNLPFTVDSARLAGLFENAGTVEMVEVIYDKITGRSKGFGFVTMSSVAEVEAAAQQFNGYQLEGRALRVNSGPPSQRENSFRRVPRTRSSEVADAANRLYVGNLSWDIDNLALQEFFSEHGKVVDARVVYDRDTGKSKGFGFVTYSSAEEVDNAIESLDGAEMDGRAIRVSVAEAKPRQKF